MAARRTPAEIARDRAEIVAELRRRARLGEYAWVRVARQDWRPNDVAALVADGVLVRRVRREWDTQQFRYATDLFGGAGVVQRHRAYVALATEVTVA